MQKTDRLTKIISLLMFLALAAYIGVYLVGSLLNPIQTSPAVRTTIVESGRSEGIIVRSEQLIESSLPYIDVALESGERVSAGATIATSYSNEDGLRRADRVRELRLEIARIEALLSGAQSAEDMMARESFIQNAVLSLTSAVARHETENLEALELNLRSLVLGDGAETVTRDELLSLEAELGAILQSVLASGDTTVITARSAGTFSAAPDGFEHLSPQSLNGLTPSSLEELMSQRRETPEDAIGKLVSSQKWFYAAKMTGDDAARLSAGDSVEADFGRYYDKLLSLRVESVSRPENGESVVLFSCSQALADTLSIRFATAEIKFTSYSGIRIPSGAVHVDEDGSRFVYVVTAMTAEKKPIEIIYWEDDFVLAATDPLPNGLREGNEIIVRARGLYDGKVLN